jgi:site-specific DNA recombinase
LISRTRPAEAATVRFVFRRYLELGTVRALRDDLAATGVLSKCRTAADGSPYGGQRFSRGALYLMLKNRIYRGEIVHKGKAFPGEHAAIVDEELWRRVQSHLEENRMERREGDKAIKPSLLAGIVFDASSEPMTPTHAVKKGTRYRYYISRYLITGLASDSSRGQRVPASDLETLVVARLRALLANPVEMLTVISSGERDAPMQKRLRDVAQRSLLVGNICRPKRCMTLRAPSSSGRKFTRIALTSRSARRVWSVGF